MRRPAVFSGLMWPFFCFVIIACSSTPAVDEQEQHTGSVQAKSLEEVTNKNLETSITAGSYLDALQELAHLKFNKNIDFSSLAPYREQALQGLLAEFNKKAEEKNYLELYRLYLSLAAAAEKFPLPEWSEKRILFAFANELAEKEEHLSAQVYYNLLLKRDLLSKEEVRALIDYASKHNFHAFLEGLVKKAALLGLKPEEKVVEQAKQKILPAQLLKGTATVWVDKGIKIEGGVGLPDRVLGSSFFIDARGYLLTNYHVIESEVDPEYEGFSRLYIRLPGRTEEKVPAKVIGWDKVFDVALLKAELKPDYFIQLMGGVAYEPGDKVYAIGSPLDPLLENTITSGIISATNRRHFLQLGDVIQVDAPVNPGNSGGPLLTEKGDFLGIIFGGLKPLEGLNFAIPANYIKQLLPALYRGGKIQHPWLGLSLTEVENKLEVIYALPGEAGERGGIKAGDILYAINDKPFTSIRDWQAELLDYPTNCLVKLTWYRQSEQFSNLFLLKERPLRPLQLALTRDTRDNVLLPMFGMELKYVDQFLWEKNYVVGKVITGSIADNTGISANDPINIQKWRVDEKAGFALLQVFIRKKTEGFMQNVIQLAAYLETDDFI